MLSFRVPYQNIPEHVKRLCQVIQGSGHSAHIVGGAVRDLLLGKSVLDWDITTSALPKTIQSIFKKTIPTGIDHGTITVIFEGHSYEVTTFRGDGPYLDGRRPQYVRFVDDLTADLRRRDFTINAIALDPITEALVDPFDGLNDLEAQLVRAVGNPTDRFDEDGLRPMRGVRIATMLDFQIEEETLRAISASQNNLRRVATERVRDEMFKLLSSDRPSIGIKLLAKTGLFDVILQEIIKGELVVDQEYVSQALCICDQLDQDATLRFAGMLLPYVRHTQKRQSLDQVGAGRRDGDAGYIWGEIDQACRRFRLTRVQSRRIAHILSMIDSLPTEASTLEARRFLRRLQNKNVHDVLSLAAAEIRCGDGTKPDRHQTLCSVIRAIREVSQNSPPVTISQLAIDGRQVMKHLSATSSPQVGRILEALLDRVIEDPRSNQRDRLIGLIPQCVDSAHDDK